MDQWDANVDDAFEDMLRDLAKEKKSIILGTKDSSSRSKTKGQPSPTSPKRHRRKHEKNSTSSSDAAAEKKGNVEPADIARSKRRPVGKENERVDPNSSPLSLTREKRKKVGSVEASLEGNAASVGQNVQVKREKPSQLNNSRSGTLLSKWNQEFSERKESFLRHLEIKRKEKARKTQEKLAHLQTKLDKTEVPQGLHQHSVVVIDSDNDCSSPENDGEDCLNSGEGTGVSEDSIGDKNSVELIDMGAFPRTVAAPSTATGFRALTEADTFAGSEEQNSDSPSPPSPMSYDEAIPLDSDFEFPISFDPCLHSS